MSSADELVPLAWLAGRSVPIAEEELHGAVRRAMLLLAAGGDPHRSLDLDGRAVTSLADELDTPERREALLQALHGLGADAEPELAWRAYACSLLADELAGEE